MRSKLLPENECESYNVILFEFLGQVRTYKAITFKIWQVPQNLKNLAFSAEMEHGPLAQLSVAAGWCRLQPSGSHLDAHVHCQPVSCLMPQNWCLCFPLTKGACGPG